MNLLKSLKRRSLWGKLFTTPKYLLTVPTYPHKIQALTERLLTWCAIFITIIGEYVCTSLVGQSV